ncbi:MAG: glycerate kinase, partial [Chloroflexi bacterium]|nr:glycerate kinase [Chloroflexota bacterium]
PGTAAIVAAAGGGRLVDCPAPGPLGDALASARYACLEGERDRPLAVVEAAVTAGLVLVAPERRMPALGSSTGVGRQVAHALAHGARDVVIGVGGTGTNDGGAGAAQALGLRLLDAAGADLPPGGIHLIRLARVDARDVDPALAGARLRIAVDVTNPLLGPSGATAVYGPQKGVDAWLAPALEQALARWAERLRADLGVTVADEPGAGAGGGLGVGLIAAARAAGGTAGFESGATLVAEAIGLRAAVAASDLVITGEGRLDAQTAFGKAVAYVAALARERGKPCVAVAGAVDGVPPGIDGAESLTGAGVDVTEAMRGAAALAEAATARLVGRHAGRDGVRA